MLYVNSAEKMELLIMGSACALGYYLNANGKQPRSVNNKIVVSPNRLPCGPLIYDNDRVKQVDEYIKSLAAKKAASYVKQNFPDYKQPIQVSPGDLMSTPGYPAPVQALGNDSAQTEFSKTLQSNMQTNLNAAAFDPASGRPYVATDLNIDSSPMFRDFQPKDTPTSTDAPFLHEFQGPVSLLSGQPLDMSHGRQEPYFGPSVKQVGVDNENSLVRLERFTGTPSYEDQGTYRPKREVENPMPNNPDPLQRAQIDQLPDLYARAQSAIKPSHEFISPVKQFRDKPISSNIRISSGNPDSNRSVLSKQVTYQGVMIPGQKGSTRALIPKMGDNKFYLPSEVNPQGIVPNRATQTANPNLRIPGVRNNLSTEVYEAQYIAPPVNQKARRDIGAMASMYSEQLNNQVSKQLPDYSPGFGVASGKIKSRAATGVLIVNDPEKGLKNVYSMLPNAGNKGSRMRNVDAPDTTLNEALSTTDAATRNISSGVKDNTAWGKKDFKLDPTSKDMNNEGWTGLPKYNLGMGNKKAKYEDWVTMKELVEFENMGNPSCIPAHMSYDSVFEMDYTAEQALDRVGIARAPITAKTGDGGEMTREGEVPLLVENYINAPKGVSMGMVPEDFTDSVEMDYDRIDFGGHYNGGKIGQGEYSDRSAEYRTKNEMNVEGRPNPPLMKEKLNEHLGFEVNLRADSVEDREPRHPMIQTTQPRAVVTDRMPVVIKTKNSEALNPRMDPDVRITSDLYPWIRNRSDSEDVETV